MEDWKNNLPQDVAAMTEPNRPMGKPHVKQGVLSGYWLFNKSGRYGATVARNGKKCRELKIVIFDCFQKEAFDYLIQTTELQTEWFYWFEDYLVLISLNFKKNQPALYCFEMNHMRRSARLIYIRNNFVKAFSNRTYDVSVRPAYPVILKTIGYIPLFGAACLYLLPIDPFSNCEHKKYFAQGGPFDWTIVNGEFGVYSHMLLPIVNVSSIYMFKTFRTSGNKCIYRLDRLIKIDLEQLAEGNEQSVIGSQMHLYSGRKTCTICLYNNITKMWTRALLLDLDQKRVSCTSLNVTWGTRLPINTLHPCGQAVQIVYEKNEKKLSLKKKERLEVPPMQTLKSIAKRTLLLFFLEYWIAFYEFLNT